jgi:DNA-binding CsgD family transcriptional regulator
VGKTRLAGELLAGHDDIVTLSARASPLGATDSFGLWAEAFERHLRALPAAEVSRLCGGFLDDLAGLLRSVAAVRGSAPGAEPPKSRLLEGLTVLLDQLADQAPLAVVLDDVHWADASSWEALQYLGHNLVGAPVLVLMAARPAELGEHPVAAKLLFNLEQEDLLVRLEVRPLDAGAVSELAAAVLGEAPPEALVGWLGERTCGNPLFTLGLLRALQDEGADLGAPRLRRIPEGLAERVAERLKDLEAATRSTLEVLAVVGRRVEVGDLVALAGQPLDHLAPILDRLVRLRLVADEERGAELTYEIAHPLIQEAVYQGVGTASRRALHRLVARSLLGEGRLGEAAAHFAHSAEAGDPEAVAALIGALRQAEERGTYREALTILGSIVDILAPGDERWREVADAIAWQAEWVIDHRADAHALLGIKALSAIDGALAHTPQVARRAAVKLRLGSFLAWGTGDLEEAERCYSEAVSLFESAGEAAQALVAKLELAFLTWVKGDMEGGLRSSRAVAAEAEACDDRLVLMHSVGRGIGYSALFGGRFEEAEAAYRRGLALAVEDDKVYFQTLTLGGLACTLAMSGRVGEALLALDEAKGVNSEWRDNLLLEWQAMIRWLAGDFPAAVASAEESAAWNPGALSKRRGLGMFFAVLSAIETGQWSQARRHLARGQAPYQEREWIFFRGFGAYAKAMLAWHTNQMPDSIDAVQRAAAGILATGAKPFAALAFLDLAELAAESDRVDLAHDAVGHLEEIAGALDCGLYHALAALASSWADLSSGAPARAVGPARQAVDLLAPTGCRCFSGRALEAFGRALSGRDRPGAVAAFEEAVALFESCGATWRRDRAVERLGQLGTQGRRAAAALSGPASLTRRERQVAKLAAQGHTVRQIGERLYISERTVETHLSAVYAKLGVASKAELVGRAVELD